MEKDNCGDESDYKDYRCSFDDRDDICSMRKRVKELFANAFENFFYSRARPTDSLRLQSGELSGMDNSKDEILDNPGFSQRDLQHVSCFSLENHYGVENLLCKTVDLNVLGPNDVFIEVHYVGLNFSDVYSIKGLFLRKPLPYVPGIECSGKVLAVGSEVDFFKVGDTVMVLNPQGGLLMEKVIVNKNCVFHFNNMKYGAAIPVNYLTAMEIVYSGDLFKYFGLENDLSDQECDYDEFQKIVLFHGCSGGVGSAFYDVTKNMEVKHLGTCSVSKHNLTKYESFKYENWDNDVRRKYPEGVDVVIETISGPNTTKSLDILKQNGHLFVIGATSALEENPNLDEGAFVSVEKLIMKNISVTGINIQTLFDAKPNYVRSVMNFLSSLYHENIIEPRISAVFEFRETAVAIKYLIERKNVGKVLIRIKN